MIIKSMSRKDRSFAQLIDYMTDVKKSEQSYFVFHNVYGSNAEALKQEFIANSQLVKKRKNGVYLYHEILSIKTTENLAKDEQKRLLRDIAQDYATERAEPCMVFGALHDDHDDHLHYHLLISANPVGQSTKYRMSKAEFDGFKRRLENHVLAEYPQLEQTLTMSKEAGEKLSKKGAEIKRRTGKTPQRDQLKDTLTEIFKQSTDKASFFSAMSDAGLEMYARGKTLGVKDTTTCRNHRLKTLGVLEDFDALSLRIELDVAKQQTKDTEDTQVSQSAEQSEDIQNTQPTGATKNTAANRVDRVNLKAKDAQVTEEAEKATVTSDTSKAEQTTQQPAEQTSAEPSAQTEPEGSAVEKERQRRRTEAERRRVEQATGQSQQTEQGSSHKPKP